MAGFIALLCVSVSLCENMFSFTVFFYLECWIFFRSSGIPRLRDGYWIFKLFDR